MLVLSPHCEQLVEGVALLLLGLGSPVGGMALARQSVCPAWEPVQFSNFLHVM